MEKNAGKDLREVLLDAKRQLKEKFEDYLFFEEGLNELRMADATSEEIAEYAVAAKKMMEDRGIEEGFCLGPDEEEAMKELNSLINAEVEDIEEDYE